MQVKVCFPKQYNAPSQPFIYRTDNSIADVKARVARDLAHAHEQLATGQYNGSVFNATCASDITLLDVQVDIYVPRDNAPDLAQQNLKAIVEIWAQRCRVTGVRGNRFYAIEDPLADGSHSFTLLDADTLEELDDPLDGNRDVIMRTNLLIGTTVFYNDRFVTLGFPGSVEQVALSLENLFQHVHAAEPTVGLVVRVDSLIIDAHQPGLLNEYRFGI